MEITTKLDQCYCKELKWYDFGIFFGLNIGAHIFTVRYNPGSGIRNSILVTLAAIFFPYARILEELEKIAQVPLDKLPCIWKEDEINKAKRAGALCIVIQGLFGELSTRMKAQVYGQGKGKRLPRGYMLEILTKKHKVEPKQLYYYASISHVSTQAGDTTWPTMKGQCSSTQPPTSADNQVNRDETSSNTAEDVEANAISYHSGSNKLLQRRVSPNPLPKFTLPQTSTYLKAAVSIGQATYAIFTLIQASKECGRLTMFGYISPVFIVLPYAIMSLVNALSVLTTPNYPMLYVVYTETVDGAIQDGWEFDCQAIVAELGKGNDKQKPKSSGRVFMKCVTALLGTMSLAGPYIAMGLLTGFQTGQSTETERVIITLGVAIQQIALFWKGIWWLTRLLIQLLMEPLFPGVSIFRSLLSIMVAIAAIVVITVALIIAIIIPPWSFMIVGQMLRKTGNCTYL